MILPLYNSDVEKKNTNKPNITKNINESNNNQNEINCYWEKWTQWSVCDASTYLKKRTRLCNESNGLNFI